MDKRPALPIFARSNGPCSDSHATDWQSTRRCRAEKPHSISRVVKKKRPAGSADEPNILTACRESGHVEKPASGS